MDDRRLADDEDRILRAVVEGVESETGEGFFRSLVRHLASALGVQYAFVSELTRGGTHFRTRAVWARGAPGADFEIPLAGTPCEAVLRGEMAHHPDRLQEIFPSDHGLKGWNAVGYLGFPLVEPTGAVVGHLAVMHDRPLSDGARGMTVMRIFAARARAELQRLRADEALRASEDRLARVFDAASDGILSFDEEGRIVLFNPAAERILRCPRAEAIGSSAARFGSGEGLAARTRALERLQNEPGAVVFFGESEGLHARRADGTLFLHEGSFSRSRADGRPLYTVIFRDVDERRAVASALAELERQNEYLKEEIRSLHPFDEIVGRSPALREVLRRVELVAGTDASVLITGETGTGKELVARAIHSHGARRARPLVKVNCAALPTGLVESELFGHEKGAFTGATERRLGRFELADGGTIFLDEVGEVPADVQVKLLRVLQERELERVGGSRTIGVDVRVIAATNRDLSRAVADGSFRQDLYYRLNVFPVHVPSLRERNEDVPLLVHFFVSRFAAKIGRRIERVAEDTLERLAAYAWPGNVRELENVVERAVILSPGPALEVPPEMLPAAAPAPIVPSAAAAAAGAASAPDPAPGEEQDGLEGVERRHIVATLRRTGWRIDGPRGAAAILKLHPSTLRSRMQRLGIRRSHDAES